MLGKLILKEKAVKRHEYLQSSMVIANEASPNTI